ncbi:MAG: phosphotransferase family protein [bacterium]
MNPDDFDQKLEKILITHIADCDSLLSAARLSGGASQETYRIEIKCKDQVRVLAMRRAIGGGYNEPGLAKVGLAGEAKLMQLAREAGVPAPEIFYLLNREDDLGDGFIMEWIEGEALGARIVRRPEYESLRPELAYEIGKVLARIHRIDVKQTGLEDILATLPPREFITQTWDRYIAMDTPQPMIDYAGRWLLENLTEDHDQTLVHNDFRNGNFMVTPQQIVAVLDWEAAHIGDPMRDLGWICTNSWRYGGDAPVGGFGSYEDLFRGYEEVSGNKINLEEVIFWQVFGSFWWSVTCLGMVVLFREGKDASIERASIGRRTSEALVDCVNLVIPGPVEVIAAHQSEQNLDMPGAAELLGSVIEFLRDQVMTETGGRTNFMTRVSANSLDIVKRELSLLEAHRSLERSGLQAIYDTDDDLETLRWRLVHGLRDGTQSLDSEPLKAHLRNTIVNQVAIDQPRYSGFKQALEISSGQ